MFILFGEGNSILSPSFVFRQVAYKNPNTVVKYVCKNLHFFKAKVSARILYSKETSQQTELRVL